MSNYSFCARASCLFLATAMFLVLGRYTVHAEATHSGEFNFSGPGSTIFILPKPDQGYAIGVCNSLCECGRRSKRCRPLLDICCRIRRL